MCVSVSIGWKIPKPAGPKPKLSSPGNRNATYPEPGTLIPNVGRASRRLWAREVCGGSTSSLEPLLVEAGIAVSLLILLRQSVMVGFSIEPEASRCKVCFRTCLAPLPSRRICSGLTLRYGKFSPGLDEVLEVWLRV